MKKNIFYIALVSFASVSFVSCKKDWTCTCTDKTTGEKYAPFSIANSRRPEASLSCKSLTIYGGNVDCKLD